MEEPEVLLLSDELDELDELPLVPLLRCFAPLCGRFLPCDGRPEALEPLVLLSPVALVCCCACSSAACRSTAAALSGSVLSRISLVGDGVAASVMPEIASRETASARDVFFILPPIVNIRK